MNKEFIPYKLEVKLVELGFNEKTFDVHSDIITQGFKVVKKPTPKILYQQAFRFFREKYSLNTWIHVYVDNDNKCFQYTWVITLPHKDDGYVYDTYEEAELACLEKLIEIAEKL